MPCASGFGSMDCENNKPLAGGESGHVDATMRMGTDSMRQLFAEEAHLYGRDTNGKRTRAESPTHWVIVSPVTRRECEHWLCIVCRAKRVRDSPGAPLVDVTNWPTE